MDAQTKRPAFVTSDHLNYLDELRSTGLVNMFDAWWFIRHEFGANEETAKKILSYWIEAFGDKER